MKWYLTRDSEVVLTAQFFLFGALLNNWREYLFYLQNSEEPFLFPCYFSFFGLFNVTPLGDEIADEIDLWAVIYDLTAGEAIKDGHHFTENKNFCFYEGHIRMRDYGSKRTQEIITKYWAEFNSLPRELINGW